MRLTSSYIKNYDLACKILIESNINFFPVNPLKIANHFNILVISYEQFVKENLGTLNDCFEISQDGFSFLRDDRYIICYNDKILNKGRRRFTITHEISHILLGHINHINSDLAYNETSYSKKQMELEADMLTVCILAPITIAHMCDITTARDMMLLFGLSKEASENIFKNYYFLRKSRELDKINNKQLYFHFFNFISENFYKKHHNSILSK